MELSKQQKGCWNFWILQHPFSIIIEQLDENLAGHRLFEQHHQPISSYNRTTRSQQEASPVAQMIKNLPAMRETQVWSLGQEYLLGKGMATHSNILAWRVTGTEEPSGLYPIGSQRIGHDLLTLSLFISNKSRIHIHFTCICVDQSRPYFGPQNKFL